MHNPKLARGTVKHVRYKPKDHAFSQPLYMFYLDLSALEQSLNSLPYCSYQRFNYHSYYRKHYFDGSSDDLGKAINDYVASHSNVAKHDRITMLTHLACMDYCFNPITLYFGWQETTLLWILAEVTNTPWGERHFYLLTDIEKISNDVYQTHFQKELHVSPFLAMDYHYDMRIKISFEKIIVHIKTLRSDDKVLEANLALDFLPWSRDILTECMWRMPLMTQRVICGIHWQAVRLYTKGVPYVKHP